MPDPTLIAGAMTLISKTGTGSCTSPTGMSQSVGGNFIKLDDCGPGGYAHEIGHGNRNPFPSHSLTFCPSLTQHLSSRPIP